MHGERDGCGRANMACRRGAKRPSDIDRTDGWAAAIQAGADQVHGSALGMGERVGNTPLDQLLVNLKLLGWIDNDLSRLGDGAVNV